MIVKWCTISHKHVMHLSIMAHKLSKMQRIRSLWTIAAFHHNRKINLQRKLIYHVPSLLNVSNQVNWYAKKAKKNEFWNAYKDIVIDKIPLPQVFETIQFHVNEATQKTKEAKHPSALRFQKFLRTAIDTFYFNIFEQRNELPIEFIHQVLDYLNTTLFPPTEESVLDRVLNESVFSSMILLQLHLDNNNADNAWEKLDDLIKREPKAIHFRTVRPLLDADCAGSFPNYLRAYHRWQYLKTFDLQWGTLMETTLVSMLRASITHFFSKDHESEIDYNEFISHMKNILEDLRLANPELSQQSIDIVQQICQEHNIETSVMTMDSNVTTCSCCGSPFKKFVLNELEQKALLQSVVSYKHPYRKHRDQPEGKSTIDLLHHFHHWLLEKISKNSMKKNNSSTLHYILDGPNIAYLGQNFLHGRFRLDHVDQVVNLLLEQGHDVTITIPNIYLKETSIMSSKITRNLQYKPKRVQTFEEAEMIKRWEENGLIYSCDTKYLSDDVFWVYGSLLLGQRGRIITNDRGRDHILTLLNERHIGLRTNSTTENAKGNIVITRDTLARWKDSTIVNIDIHHDRQEYTEKIEQLRREGKKLRRKYTPIPQVKDIQLHNPLPFSYVPQMSTNHTSFHLPFTNETNKWLCVKIPKF